MAKLFQGVQIQMERRHVAVLVADGHEKLGFFHKWSYDNDLEKDFALVESTGGKMGYFPVERIRFLAIGDDIHPEELEKTYHELGLLLKGGG